LRNRCKTGEFARSLLVTYRILPQILIVLDHSESTEGGDIVEVTFDLMNTLNPFQVDVVRGSMA
jgi:hypothetical protein